MQTLFFVSHTHWDREWYEPFQLFRIRLIRCIDVLMDILESNSAYEHFMLDGQTIVLEDYLQVRPDRVRRILPFLYMPSTIPFIARSNLIRPDSP